MTTNSARSVVFQGAGGNEVVQVVHRAIRAPIGREVAVRVHYSGLNPADIAQREGRYPAPPGVPANVPGLEVAGVVEGVATAVERWKVGDRVMGIVAGGGLSELVLADEDCLVPVPHNMEDVVAAAVPEAYITAHDGLVRVGGIRPGDSVLINGGNGAVGTAAIQLVRAFGGSVVATSRSTRGREYIVGLGATASQPMQAGDVSPALDQEFDLIIELVGGDNLTTDVAMLAKGGRLVVIGVPAGDRLDVSARLLMAKRATVTGTTLRHRPRCEKAAAVRRFEHEVLPLFDEAKLSMPIEKLFAAEDAVLAFDRLAASGKTGKVLLDFGAANTAP